MSTAARRWLVTGAHGQLGSDLQTVLAATPGATVAAYGSKQLDVTSRADIAAAVAEVGPDVIVNAAAYTAVDAAEDDRDAAFAVNATAPALLAAEAVRAGARLLHVSTDYVFDGTATSPYDVTDPTGPRSVYGETKLAGELAVREILPAASYVVRTAWLYGAHGHNFVKTMARLEKERETLNVVDDQRGSPTWSHDLAAGLLALAAAEVPAGTFHATNRGETTWRGFAQAVFEELGADPARVLPTTSEAYPTPAARPAYSVLSPRAWDDAGLPPLRDWRAALAEAFRTSGDALRG